MKSETLNDSIDYISEKVGIFGAKVSNQKHLAALRDAFATQFPFLFAGSFALLINSVFILPTSLLANLCGAADNPELYESWAAVSMYLAPLFRGIVGATMDFFAIYIALLLGYFLAGNYGDNKIFGGMIGLACFIALQPTNAIAGNPLVYFNSSGLIFAMFAGLTGPAVFHKISHCDKLIVKMPDGVPPAVAKSFNYLFPVVFTIVIYSSMQFFWGAFAYGVGFGASETEHIYYTLSGTITYDLADSDITGAKASGDIKIEQGTQLFFVMNFGFTQITEFEDYTIGELKEIISKLPENPFITEEFVANWFNAQIVSAINNESWLNIEITGLSNNTTIGSISTFVEEEIKVISEDWYYLINALNSIIVLPLQNIGDSAWFVFIIYGLTCFIFFFGIHGPNTLEAIISPIYVAAAYHNVDVLIANGGVIEDALASGDLLIFTNTTISSFVVMGGVGVTMGLMVALWLFSDSPASREVNKVGTVPILFNINEPYIFGLPIMLNPIYAIPFILLEPCVAVGVYFITAMGWMNPTMFIMGWTTPVILSGFIVTGGDVTAIYVSIAILLISFLSYAPFVILDAKQQVKNQLINTEHKNYKDLKEELSETREQLAINPNNEKLLLLTKELKLKLKMIEEGVSELNSFNLKTSSESKYFTLGEKVVKNKYELLYENQFNQDENKKDIKDQLKVFDDELKFLAKQGKCDTKIITSNNSFTDKVNKLESDKDLSIAKLESKASKVEDKTLIKTNKNKAKLNILIEQSKRKIVSIKKDESLIKEIKQEKIDLINKNILDETQKIEVQKEKLNNNKVQKQELISRKIEKVGIDTKESIKKLQEKHVDFVSQMKNKIKDIKAKKENNQEK